MPVKIIQDDDIYITQEEFDEYHAAHQRAINSYGEKRTFEEFVKEKRNTDKMVVHLMRASGGKKYKGHRPKIAKGNRF